MKNILTTIAFALGALLPATAAETLPLIQNVDAYENTTLNGIQDYYNRKGLVSDKGEKKKAFYVLKEWYEGK